MKARSSSTRLAAVTADSITEAQCAEVSNTCGHRPSVRDPWCKTCNAPSGFPCCAARGGPRGKMTQEGVHVAREQAVEILVRAWRVRCAEAWNARHGGAP